MNMKYGRDQSATARADGREDHGSVDGEDAFMKRGCQTNWSLASLDLYSGDQKEAGTATCTVE